MSDKSKKILIISIIVIAIIAIIVVICCNSNVEKIQNNLRKNDILIRWGGEEFILILQLESQKDLEKKLEYLSKTPTH